MWFHPLRVKELRANMADHPVHHIQYRRHRSEIHRERQFLPAFRFGFAQADEIILHVGIDLRIGALKAEDRLFEIADHEQAAELVTLAAPGKIFLHQRADHLPLQQVGILRLINQHVIDAAVELEAHPIGGARFAQQARGGGDHVVIIDHPGPVLGRAPILRQPHRDAQMPASEFEYLPAFQIGADAEQLFLHFGAEGPPVRQCLGDHPIRLLGFPIALVENLPEAIPGIRFVGGHEECHHVSADANGALTALLRHGLPELLQFQQRQRHDPRRQRCRLAVTIGQPQRPAQQRLHAFNAKFGQRLAVAGQRGHDCV